VGILVGIVFREINNLRIKPVSRFSILFNKYKKRRIGMKYIIEPLGNDTTALCFGRKCGCNLPVGFCSCFGDGEVYSTPQPCVVDIPEI